MIVCYEGSIRAQSNQVLTAVTVTQFEMSSQNEEVVIKSLTDKSRVILLAGRPLNEPIV